VPGWGQFEYDGEMFPIIPPDEWSIDECIELERATMLDLFDVRSSKLLSVKALAWVSIVRLRPAFTLLDAGRLTIHILGAINTAYGDAVEERRKPAPSVAVLSPTPADTTPSRTDRRSAKKGANTHRR
jgi:hypothetical protein